MYYKIQDITTGDFVKGQSFDTRFDTREEAEVWCEENGVDYDYFEIVEIED